MKIMIDPGHGGSDPGAVNGTHQEKKYALSIAHRLALMLWGTHGLRFTRTTDIEKRPSNNDRCVDANQWGADIFVSIHLNSAEADGANGHEVIYCPGSARGVTLATCINNELPGNDRGVKTDDDLGRGFPLTVLRNTAMPAVIVECGFISNADDLAFMAEADNRDKFARAILNGIIKFKNAEAAAVGAAG